MKPGLSGYVCIRNAIFFDYCIREAVMSLLPVCDEVIISDGQSDDGTFEILKELAKMDSRVRIITYPWDNPVRDIGFWTRWMNTARGHLRYATQLEVDADEIIDPAGYDQIRALVGTGKSALFQRLNFWKDSKHLAPENVACGTQVARLGPTSAWMCSDEPFPAVNPNIRTDAEPFPTLRIFHYGFIRDPKAFVRKSVAVQNMFFGSCDSRITEMDAQGKDWRDRDYFEGLKLREYNDYHPEVAHQWLLARGYSL
jgi:glycosyltransferase involved in cell wall biosynthesis